MQVFGKKQKTTTIITFAIAFILLSSALLASGQPQYLGPQGYGYYTGTNIQDNGSTQLPSGVTPDMTVTTTPYLSFRPNPVGENQTILVNLWLDPGPSVTRYFRDLTVTITKPDGTTDVKKMNSYFADSTAWFEYEVDQTGTWKLKFDFPGAYFPAGNYTMLEGTSNAGFTENYPKSVYYEPASTGEQTLTVQEEPVLPWPSAELPNNYYWTRPVMAENREWATILGDYPWRGPATCSDAIWPANTNRYWSPSYSFTPYVQGPTTSHIVWKRPGVGVISGLYGGDVGTISMQSGGGNPTIVYQGRAYQTVTKPMPQMINGSLVNMATSVWQCYDFRTGEIIWEETGLGNAAPTVIEYDHGLPAVPGAEAAVGVTASLIAITGSATTPGRLLKYNPATGAVTVNVSIPAFTTSLYYMNEYVLSVQQLNASGGPGDPGTPTAGIYRLINWTTSGSSSNFTSRIITNQSWPRADLGPYGGGAGNPQDFSVGIGFNIREPNFFDLADMGYPYVNIAYDNASGFRYGTRIQAYSYVTGELLWDKTVNDTMYSGTTNVADHGKLAVLMRDGTFMAWDYDGTQLWRSERMDYPWDAPGFGAYSIASAYGMFYRFGYGGVYAFDWNTGKIVWKYTAPAFSEYETPYTDENGTTVYSFNAGCQIADGKIYIYNTEHTPSQPITRGWGLHCINATTGELIWKIKTPGAVGPISDGYMSVSGSDGIQYVYGKGQSQTTVTAPQTAVPVGTTVLIQGTVLDMSPAQPGTPCVSAESMTTYMEYLHKQQPIDGLWHNETVTGVPVQILAIGPDNETIDLGIVTSDMSGKFQLSWTTPQTEGVYKITATFMGDGSYGSSWDETGLIVGQAQATPSSSSSAISVNDVVGPLSVYIIAGVIAVIIAIAIVGVMILRKHP
jgi:outer membrane protein assembly factor BamB